MRALGCDIGNGYAYVSLLNDETGQPECALPPIWGAAAGMPTDAYVQADGTIVTGNPPHGAVAPGRTLRAIKRCLAQGRVTLEPCEGSTVDSVMASEVYGAIARRALNESEKFLLSKGVTPPADVVLTYPASFADSRRLIATMQAAVGDIQAASGKQYRVVGSIPEPAAIALDYLHFMRHEVAPHRRLTSRDVNVVVFDLGHGTFDTALVTARAVEPGNKEQPWDLHDYDGLAHVGGIDFDEALVNLFYGRIQSITGSITRDAFTEDTLRESAVRCKHELSEATSTDVRLFLPNGQPVRFEVTRSEFEHATEHLLEQTLEKVETMFESAERLGLPVTHVVLSGGGSQMPMVRRRVSELVGDDVTVTLFRPSEAVSFGAARYARTLTEPEVSSTSPMDTADTVDARMDLLFKPVLTDDSTKEDTSEKQSDEFDMVQHVPYPMGVLYSGRTGHIMRVLLHRGATEASPAGLLQLRSESTYVELVVARALDKYATKKRLRTGEFREVCRLTCHNARPNTTYDIRIEVGRDGTVAGTLISDEGSTIRMEMN